MAMKSPTSAPPYWQSGEREARGEHSDVGEYKYTTLRATSYRLETALSFDGFFVATILARTVPTQASDLKAASA
jgi:hypothetical protein